MNTENEKLFQGIFFIEESALLELDNLLLATHKSMMEKSETQLNNGPHTIPSRVEPGIYIELGSPQIIFTSDREGKFETFRDAIKSRVFDDSLPRQFKATVIANDLKQVIELRHNFLYSDIRIQTSNPDKVDWIDIASWADKQVQPWYIRAWAKYSFLMFMLSVLLLMGYAGYQSEAMKSRVQSTLKAEASEMLAKGISAENRDHAIEVMLQWQTGVMKNPPPPADNTAFGILLALCVTIWVISYFHPKSALGIGKGKKSIQMQKGWVFVVTKVLTTLATSGVVIGFLKDHFWQK